MKIKIVTFISVLLISCASPYRVKYLKYDNFRKYEYDFQRGLLTNAYIRSDEQPDSFVFQCSSKYLPSYISSGYDSINRDSIVINSEGLIKEIYKNSKLLCSYDYDSLQYGIVKSTIKMNDEIFVVCRLYSLNGGLIKEATYQNGKLKQLQEYENDSTLINPYLHTDLKFPFSVYSKYGLELHPGIVIHSMYCPVFEKDSTSEYVTRSICKYNVRKGYPTKKKMDTKIYLKDSGFMYPTNSKQQIKYKYW